VQSRYLEPTEDKDKDKMKVGDKVYVSGRGRNDGTVAIINRETKTQWITGDGDREMRWRKDNGRLVGADVWNIQYIYELTPELIDQYRSELRVRKQKNIFWKIRELAVPTHIEPERLQEIYEELRTKKEG
jgi:hypothetical protein